MQSLAFHKKHSRVLVHVTLFERSAIVVRILMYFYEWRVYFSGLSKDRQDVGPVVRKNAVESEICCFSLSEVWSAC